MRINKNKLYVLSSIVVLFLVIFLIAVIFRNDEKPVYLDTNSERPILGDAGASVKVVEFSDLQCPACKAVSNYPDRLINEFGNSVSVEFKHFPLSFHKYAFDAAMASECANDEGKFWDFLELSFKNQASLSKSDLKSYAKSLGLDMAKFDACLDSEAKRGIVESDMREGYALNIPGTPTFFVNGVMVDSINYDVIAGKVREELAK